MGESHIAAFVEFNGNAIFAERHVPLWLILPNNIFIYELAGALLGLEIARGEFSPEIILCRVDSVGGLGSLIKGKCSHKVRSPIVPTFG